MGCRGGWITRGWYALLLGASLPAAQAWADGPWPTPSPEWLSRGTGGGLAILPLVIWWLWVVGWTATSDWVTRDSTQHNIHPNLWGALVAFPFVVFALLAWWIPMAIVGYFLMAAAWLTPVIVYSLLRDKEVPESERVLTLWHGRRILASMLSPLGIEISTSADGQSEMLPTVVLMGAGGKTPDENAMRSQRAAAMPGYKEAHKWMVAAVVARASGLTFLWTPAAVTTRHEVDGVWGLVRVLQSVRTRKMPELWGDAPPLTIPLGDSLLAALKVLAGLDPQDRRTKQTGTFAMHVDGKPRNCRLSSQRAASGEQLLVQVESSGLIYKNVRDVGMPQPIADRIGELLSLENGLLVLSSPPGSGLSTTFDVVVQSADRLVRDFISIEDAASPPREIQNVKPIQFDARAGRTPTAVLDLALRDYPRAIITRDLRDRDLAIQLAALADQQQLVIVSLKANDAVEAIAKLLACGVSHEQLGRSLLGSLSQRLVRKLCPKCRDEYPTPPEFLARLRKTPEQLPHLRRPSQHGCRLCVGSKYFGRTAIFELASGATIKQSIALKADAKVLKQAAIKDGMRLLRDDGMRLVLDGTTSLDEMQRIFAAKAST